MATTKKVNKFALESTWLLLRAIGSLPRWFRYHVVGVFAYFVLRVIRYRSKVIESNLRNSFPEKSERELRDIKRKFYRHLADIGIDIVSMASMNIEKKSHFIEIKGIEEQTAQIYNTHWVGFAAHYGSWEYCIYWGLHSPTHGVAGVYRPLHSPLWDEIFKRLRTAPCSHTVPMREIMRYYVKHREEGIDGRKIIIGLISDQSPPKQTTSRWYKFLNQPTLFNNGGEQLALRFNLPVYYVRCEKRASGRYTLIPEMLYDGTSPIEEGEIVARYIKRLEQQIIERPELWLWSHRRWKLKPTADDKV